MTDSDLLTREKRDVAESDVLARAAKALREAHTGERSGSGFTRARVMNSLHRDRRRRILRWAVLSPVASLLLVGSAWAQSTGKWPVIWRAVTEVFVPAPHDAVAPKPPASVPRPAPRLEAAPPEPSPPEEPRPEPSAPPEPPRVNEPPALDTPPAPRPRRSRPARHERPPKRAVEAPSEARAEPAPDRELSRFRAAHDLHFAGARPRAAIDAYAAYLDEFPNGRFVPEARYNTALDWIKLGESSRARRALEPFAEGRYDGYRQKEAQKLLDALP